jgi:hypothetical protein
MKRLLPGCEVERQGYLAITIATLAVAFATFVAPSRGGAHLAMIVHHTDAVREYADDRQSRFGELDKALDEADGATSCWSI